MQHIAIVYFSHTGVTRQLAHAMMSGIKEQPDCTVYEYLISGNDIVNGRFRNEKLFADLQHADAIIFGAPTYMGSVAAQFKAFADASSEIWSQQGWAGKLAAGFTCGSGLNGEQSFTVQYFTTLASQHGMLWVGLDAASGFEDRGVNRMGASHGVVAHAPNGKAHESDLATASYLGKRVAALANQFHRHQSERLSA